MSGAEPEQLDGVLSADERVGDDPQVAQRHRGDGLTVNHSEHRRALELRRVVELGQPAHRGALIDSREPELDRRRVLPVKAVGPAAPAARLALEVRGSLL